MSSDSENELLKEPREYATEVSCCIGVFSRYKYCHVAVRYVVVVRLYLSVSTDKWTMLSLLTVKSVIIGRTPVG